MIFNASKASSGRVTGISRASELVFRDSPSLTYIFGSSANTMGPVLLDMSKNEVFLKNNYQ